MENLRLLLTCLREGRSPDAAELAEPRASAARRAEERIPLDQVLTAYLTGARLTWDALQREAAPEDQTELTSYVQVILAYLKEVVATVSRSYVEEQQIIAGEERDARRELTEALLTAGTAPVTLAERAGILPLDPCRAVALRFGATADETDRAVSTAIAGRRKVRRAVTAFETLTGGPALTLLDANGGAAIVGLRMPDDLDELHRTLSEAIGGEVWLAVSDAVKLPALPAAWRQATEVRHLVSQLQHPAGVHTLEDVLLERTLTADTATARRLAAILDPLAEREDLMATLDAWFAADFDRRAAAQVLMVHPNTLDYRLRRIGELTGKDLTSAAGSQLIGAALLARKLAQ
ncbi:helix-turn-helix domain-containing protein [soil metagenome]